MGVLMFSRSRIAATALAVAAPALAFAAPAQACYGGCDDGDISVHVSDSTPASGQQFIARGQLIMGGLPAANHVVKFQTYRNGAWEPISGARMTTDSDGKYRMRLILSQTGTRTLRVVGVGVGPEPTERQKFTVTVH
jgi:hypothetical protein